jgi:hypothetical protein
MEEHDMKYLSIVVAALLVLLAAPLKAQSAPDSVSAMWHRGGGGQGSNHGNNGWQGRGNGGREGERGRNGDRGRGWNRDDEHGRGRDGHWVWVPTRRPVLRCHWAFGHMRWTWEWASDWRREWHRWN